MGLTVVSHEKLYRAGVQRRQDGFGLIEVLIAVLVLAVGILGLASMQLGAKRASFEATQRSIATSLARDVVERMLSNPSQRTRYAGAASDLDVDGYSAGAPTPNCSTAACDPNELAEYDMWEWVSVVKGEREKLSGVAAGGLLNAYVCVDELDTNGNVRIIIAWQGVSEFDQTAFGTITCGDGNFGTDDKLRRQLVMTTFVTAS